jgi:hypothetical protein
MCRGQVDVDCDWCHVYKWDEKKNVGMVCTLRKGHGGERHLDVPHNRSWPMVTS